MMRDLAMRTLDAPRFHAPRFTVHGWAGGLVRRPWIVTLVVIVACAAFAAHAVSSVLAAGALAPADDGSAQPAAVARPADPAPASRRHRGDGTQLLERNMFCASCTPIAAPATGAGFTLTPAVLIETSLGGEPRATVRVLASEVQGSWGLGDTIPGLGEVSRIAPRWIELVDPAGHHGRLSLLGLEPAAGRGSDTAMSESPPAAPWAARIHKLDEQNYEVDRDLVRELVTGAARPGGMRFIPKLEQGEVKGVRVFGVTAGSIPFALGLHNGDTLEAIDGAPLKDLNQLLELYARLDQLSAVELAGTRAGKPLTRTLRLR
jgi:hypothetical protein